jgi:hypothetical protein
MSAGVLIRRIAGGQLDAEIRAELEKLAVQLGSNFSVYEGLVTRKIRITFHAAPTPSQGILNAYLAEEFAAMPQEDFGGTQ